MTVNMKTILTLTVAATTALSPLYADSAKADKKDNSKESEKAERAEKANKGDDAEDKEGQKKTPPGLMKKGGLPPGQMKKGKHSTRPEKGESLPADLKITNEPLSSVTTTSAPPVRPNPDERRVESPRGAEVLPIPSTSAPVVKGKPDQAQLPEKPLSPALMAKQERELDALLLKVILSRSNPRQRTATFQQIAAETGTTTATLEAQSKVNPKLSGGDLLMGNKIAALSGKPAVDVFNAHDSNNRWLATGESFGVQRAVLTDTARRLASTDR